LTGCDTGASANTAAGQSAMTAKKPEVIGFFIIVARVDYLPEILFTKRQFSAPAFL
jgi:hypothetical protein